MTIILISMLGLLLAGGYGAETSVEVFSPSTGQSCMLPSLPDQRYDHTANNLLLCGGEHAFTGTTCLTFSSGKWFTSHTLVEERSGHTSWQTEQGVVLMGGWYSPYTSDILDMAGDHWEASFAMRYQTEYVVLILAM